MKTKNNVQKAVTKSLAVIISLVLLSFTVNAQEFWKNVLHNNSFTQIAMVMTNETSATGSHISSTSDATSFSEFYTIEAEPALELESWMTDDALFSTSADMFLPEAEPALELEDWMMDDDNFKIRTFIVIEETDPALQLEDWMVNNKVWEM